MKCLKLIFSPKIVKKEGKPGYIANRPNWDIKEDKKFEAMVGSGLDMSSISLRNQVSLFIG